MSLNTKNARDVQGCQLLGCSEVYVSTAAWVVVADSTLGGSSNSVIYHLPSSVERGNGEVSRECSAVNPCMFLDTRFYIFLLTDFDTVRLFST